MHSFIITSLINLHFYATQLSLVFHVPYKTTMLWGYWLNCFLAAGFSLWVFYTAYARKKLTTAEDGFFIFGSLLYVCTIGSLIYLSITRVAQIDMAGHAWTYVMDERYYAFPMFFVQVVAWYYLCGRLTLPGFLYKSWLKYLFIFLIVLETGHGSYFVVKNIAQGLTPTHAIINNHPALGFAVQFIEAEKVKDPGRNIIIAGFDQKYGFIANFHGGWGVLNLKDISTVLPASSKPAVLLLALREKEIGPVMNFLRQPGVRLVRKTEEIYFYTFYANPPSANSR
jgi:hypothetical protein